VVPALIALDRLMATDRAKPVRATSLVYGLSVLISLLGSYWFSPCSKHSRSSREVCLRRQIVHCGSMPAA
jgi:hypothetical protein